jgi:hypothetical protein
MKELDLSEQNPTRKGANAIKIRLLSKAKFAKKCFFICFLVKHDSFDVYLKNELIPNCLLKDDFLLVFLRKLSLMCFFKFQKNLDNNHLL